MTQTDDLAIGDHIELAFGPLTSTWEVIELIDAGARLAFRGDVRLAGFPNRLTAPNGTVLTEDTMHAFLGRAHFASAKRVDGSVTDIDEAERDMAVTRCLAEVQKLVGMLPGEEPWPLDRNTLAGLLVGAWMGGHNYGRATKPDLTGVPSNTDAFMQLVDVLWGEMPAEQVAELEAIHPEIIAACRAIHKIVAHQ